MRSNQNKLRILEAGKVFYWQLYILDMMFHFNFTVNFFIYPVLFYSTSINGCHPKFLISLFNETQWRITSGEIIFNNSCRRTSMTQQKRSPYYNNKWRLMGCSSDIWINHCQFGECSQLSFHSLLLERKVIDVMSITILTLCTVSVSLSWSLKSLNVGLTSGSFCQQLVMIWYLKLIHLY